MNKPDVLVVNKFGDGNWNLGGRILFRIYRFQGYKGWHPRIDYLSEQPFEEQLDETVDLTQSLLQFNSLIIAGSKDGRIMANNVFGKLAGTYQKLWLVNVGCALDSTDLANIKADPAMEDAVQYYEHNTAPALAGELQNRIFDVRRLAGIVMPTLVMRQIARTQT